MRRRLTRRATLATALLLLLAATGVAFAAGASSTVNTTIGDRDGDDRLEPGPGDAYEQRSELGTRTATRPGLPLLTFGQLTDTHIVDEESPARVEFLDKVGPPFTSAYRPQEGIGPQVADAMVRQMRNAVSPVTSERIQAVMTTGDNTDNTQCNETRWMIDIHDGAANADPRSCLPEGLRPRSRKVDPNSGVEGSCATTPDGSLYDGVRGGREYYEPDSSDGEDGQGYSPRQAENGRPSTVRDFPGLFERMNEPFLPTGFGDLPWYGIFGNHDGLVQGNQNRNEAFDELATGCVKVKGLDAETSPEGVRDALIATAEGEDPDLTRTVPQDPRRHLLFKREYIAQHFVTTGSPAGHGFTDDNLASGEGNYAFSPSPGLRFVVLDSVSDAGGDGGNIDEAQFQWIRSELEAAGTAGDLTLVFAHHTLETMSQGPVSPFPPGDNPPPPEQEPVVHLGEISPEQPCASEPRGAELTLKCLFLNHPTVVGYVTGHEHQNRIRAVPRSGVDGDEASGRAGGGFWQITTASHIDWPQQSRLLDIVDNRDGSISLWGTMLDHDAPPNPGSATGASAKQLASISRELSFNDPDAQNGEGTSDARGGEGDRNVELVVRDPR